MPWWGELTSRLAPVVGGAGIEGPALLGWLLLGAVGVGLPALWRVLRIGVTLVHELGHALVGLAVGRRFTGFVVRGDMSGHTVTTGPSRGIGRVATTWAGYPAPGLVGVFMVWCAVRGWAGALLAVALLVLIGVLVVVRSWLTLAVVLALAGGVGALWWWWADAVQAGVVAGLGLVLLIGAWRHLLVVVPAASGTSSDPAVLARLTGIPRVVWLATFVAVLGWCTWTAGQLVRAAL